MNITSGSATLVLLCPAWKKRRTAGKVNENTTILLRADVVRVADAEDGARTSDLPASSLIEVGTDHQLPE